MKGLIKFTGSSWSGGEISMLSDGEEKWYPLHMVYDSNRSVGEPYRL